MAEQSEAQLANLAPPFAVGNEAAVVHAIYTSDGRAAVEAVVAPYVDAMVAAAPWAAVPAFSAEVRAWAFAEAEAEAEAWRQHIARVGFIKDDGEPRGGAVALDRAEARAARLRQNLGLSPKAYAAVVSTLLDRAPDDGAVDRIKEAARAIRAATERARGE